MKGEKEKGKVNSKGVGMRNVPSSGVTAVIIASDAILRNFIWTLRPSVFSFLKNTIPPRMHSSSAVPKSTYERNILVTLNRKQY